MRWIYSLCWAFKTECYEEKKTCFSQKRNPVTQLRCVLKNVCLAVATKVEIYRCSFIKTLVSVSTDRNAWVLLIRNTSWFFQLTCSEHTLDSFKPQFIHMYVCLCAYFATASTLRKLWLLNTRKRNCSKWSNYGVKHIQTYFQVRNDLWPCLIG